MVVRKLAQILPQLAANGGIQCKPIIFRQGRFWTTPFPAHECIATFEQTREQFLSTLSGLAWPPSHEAIAAQQDQSKHPFRSSADDSGLGIFKTPLNAYWKWNRYSVRRFGFREKLEVAPGDILLMPDGYWSLMEIWESVAEARAQGATVACILYDLVCMTHPQFVTARMRASFAKYLHKLTESADLIVTISKDVQQQLQNLADTSLFAHPLPEVTHFHLGADSHQTTTPPRHELERALFNGPQPYVMIATLEPRKNHDYVMQAFQRLWQQHPDAKIIFAGRKGWDCEGIVSKILCHPKYARQLFLFHDLTNSEVAHCYENAKGVILASHSEGFGLPIAEGLWHGSKVFASDIPVHREVGREYCDYFDLTDVQSLVTLLCACEREAPATIGAEPPRSATWEDSVSSLILKIIEFARHSGSHATHQPPTTMMV